MRIRAGRAPRAVSPDLPEPAVSTQITLDRVGRRFGPGAGQLQALEGVSLDVPAAAFVALLGPSGCGKTTVLRLVAGLDAPSGGRVGVGRTGDTPPVCSYVFQDPTLMPWASVFDNVWLPLRIAGMPRAEARERIAPVLQSLGLAGFADALPAELPRDQRTRDRCAHRSPVRWSRGPTCC